MHYSIYTKVLESIRPLTPNSLNASFSFSCGKTLPDGIWEVLACTSEVTFSSASSILPTVSPRLWESRGKNCYLIKLSAKKSTFSSTRHYKFTHRGFFRQLLVASLLRKLLAASLLQKPYASQHPGMENSEAWHPPSPPPREHSFLECSGASPLMTWGLNHLQFPH